MLCELGTRDEISLSVDRTVTFDCERDVISFMFGFRAALPIRVWPFYLSRVKRGRHLLSFN